MPPDCPRCNASNPGVARYCRNCGLTLAVGAAAVLGAGRAPHPEPLPPPAGCEPIGSAANLYFRWEAAGGGPPLLGTETLALTVFNGGNDLAEVTLRVRGRGRAGQDVFETERELEEWPRGRSLRLEIPSYELPDSVCELDVDLVKAGFGGR
jgi:hypothetical protein